MEKFNQLNFASKLVKLGHRQGREASLAKDLILNELKKRSIPFKVENFKTFLPLIKKASLSVDGKKIGCLGTSFLSGKIESKTAIISSLISSQQNISTSNINFNPLAKTISRSNFYFAPTLAINPKDIPRILKAKKIKGVVKVIKQKNTSHHILVGNKNNPDNIVFAHFDSIGPGAIDNASGVTVSISAITKFPKLLEKSLFVFDGNEELSYDQPVYWGHGFRVFEKKYSKIMDSCKKIIVVDSVGNGKTTIEKNSKFTKLAFPIKKINRYKRKIFLMYGDIDDLMTVYHSNKDTLSKISSKWLIDCEQKLRSALV